MPRLQLSDEKPKIIGRTKHFKRRTQHGTVEYIRTPESLLGMHEKKAKVFAGPSPKPVPLNKHDGLPIAYWTDARPIRSRKARGHILAIVRITGEEPSAVMSRLGLTAEEIELIGPFTKIVTWR